MRSPGRRAAATWVAAVGVLLCAPVWAQNPDDEGTTASDAAADYYQTGNQLFDSGDIAGAEKAYLQAFERNPRFDYAANLGAAQLQLGHWVDAAHHLAYAVTFVPGDLSAERREALLGAFDEAQAKVGAVRLRSRPPAQSMKLDGAAPRISAWRDLIFMSPGQHLATAEWADGASEKAFSLGAGESLDIVLAPPAEASPAAAPVADSKTETSGPPMWPVVAGVATSAVLAGVGVAFTLIGSGQSGDADARRDELRANGQACVGGCAELIELYENADSSYNTAIPFFIGSGAALVGTAAYLVLSPSGEHEADAAGPRVRVGLTGVTVSGRY